MTSIAIKKFRPYFQTPAHPVSSVKSGRGITIGEGNPWPKSGPLYLQSQIGCVQLKGEDLHRLVLLGYNFSAWHGLLSTKVVDLPSMKVCTNLGDQEVSTRRPHRSAVHISRLLLAHIGGVAKPGVKWSQPCCPCVFHRCDRPEAVCIVNK